MHGIPFARAARARARATAAVLARSCALPCAFSFALVCALDASLRASERGAPTLERAQHAEPESASGPAAQPAAQPVPTHACDAALEHALEQRVQEARLRESVHALVACGARMGGTASGERSAEWLRAAFESAGLAVELRADPEAWSHEPLHWRVAAEIGPTSAGGAVETHELARAWPWLYSPTAQGRAALTLDPERGGALLAERSPARSERSAAPLVLLVDRPLSRDGRYPVLRSLPRGDANKFPVFGISADEGASLRAALAAATPVQIEFELVAVNRRAQPKTVVARLAARAGAPSGHLVLCAHGDSDSGGPGANDNASGVAIVLEIARALAEARACGEFAAPSRELRFVVFGSEIHGSRAYLASLANDASPCLGVLNFDQSGYGSGAENLHLEPDDLPANRALVLELAALLRERDGAHGFPKRWATNKSLGGTDSYIFSGSALFKDAGVPALTVFTSAWNEPAKHPRTAGMPGESWSDSQEVAVDWDDYYHSTGDTPENTTDKEPHNMGWCARVGAVGALRWLAALDELDAQRTRSQARSQLESPATSRAHSDSQPDSRPAPGPAPSPASRPRPKPPTR